MQLLNPQFWQKFDYVLAERTEKVIGSWSVVHVVYGFNGVRLLKPGEESGAPVEPVSEITRRVDAQEHWPERAAKSWHSLEGLLRDRLGGFWIEVRMEPKIRILRRQLV